MKSFGQILTEARKKKNVTLEEAEIATKIRKKTLQALEKGDWDNLPASTFVKGLVKNYGKYLGVDTNELLAFYRREFVEKKEHKVVSVPIQKNRFRFTPQLVTVGAISLSVLGVIVYLFFQFQSFTGAPLLDLEEPKNNSRVTTSEVNLVGKTWEDALLKVNGQEVQLDPGGTFSLSVGLNPGVNIITVTATNRFGKISTVKRTVVADLSAQEKQTENEEQVSLVVKADPESINIVVEIDGKNEFEGLVLAGSERTFTASERIRLVTKNAGSTKVTFNGTEEILGKPGEQAEKVYTKPTTTTP